MKEINNAKNVVKNCSNMCVVEVLTGINVQQFTVQRDSLTNLLLHEEEQIVFEVLADDDVKQLNGMHVAWGFCQILQNLNLGYYLAKFILIIKISFCNSDFYHLFS